MRKVDLLKGTYDWVENLDEVLDVENDPYFLLYSKETKEFFKTIYMGREDNYLIFEYYNPRYKDRDCISFDTLTKGRWHCRNRRFCTTVYLTKRCRKKP